ncbi:hypothetical protein [Turicibacter sanguinis]|uniref:hypothetical protein n=1 Tax=Turicibacter sanguinis TaxID=154288 RepID=UPI0018A8C9BC|nr:hypothetical protein [Turicibacter sanguinis]
MAVIDVKCGCGYGFKKDFNKEDEILFCEACGSLVINDLASEIEEKIDRVNEIKAEIAKLEAEKKKLDLDIRIGLEGAPIGIGKKYQVNYSSWECELLDQKKIKEDFNEEELRKYTYKSARDRITIKELR